MLAVGEWHPPRHVFVVNLDHETLHIPYRVYYSPSLLRRELSGAHGVHRLILACLGTRHYDGYLRQACLAELFRSSEAWLTPYLIQLAGEYVIEITHDVAEGIVRRDIAVLGAFAKENPAYLGALQSRVTSYWSCHRDTYPDPNNYPGTKVITYLRQALD